MANQSYQPTPTIAPQKNPYLQSSGLSSYIPMSSSTDPRAANYVAPMSSGSPQLNAYGAPLYQGNVYNTNSPVVKTNPSTGQITGPVSTQPADSRLQQLAKTDRNPVQQSEYERLLAEINRGPSQEELDATFNPILDVYNQAEANLMGQQPGLIAEAEAQANASRQLLGNQRLSANELLGQQETKTTAQRLQQEAQQRQLLQELQTGNQQRFGGASSAGIAASELQGREYQRNAFGIQQGAQEALQTISQKKLEVERDYQQGLQQLEVNFQQAKNEIDRRIQDKLLEINARRGETQAAKAQARLDALQEMRNMAFQLNIARAQYETELKNQSAQNTSYLDSLANQYMNYTGAGEQAANQFATTQPGSISSVSSQTTGSTSPYIGAISRKPEEQYTGQVSPLSRTLNDLYPNRSILGLS